MSVDTSREAVERLAALWEASSWAGGGFTHTRAAATLRALLAERDAARADAARLREALETLEKGATYTHKLGAVAGSHWLGLGTALIKARAALAGGAHD